MPDYYRLSGELVLAIAFVFFLIGFAGMTGLRSFFSFIITILVLWKLLVPLYLKGINPIGSGIVLEKLRLPMKKIIKNDKSRNQMEYDIYGTYEPLTITITHVLNAKCGLGWTSNSQKVFVCQYSEIITFFLYFSIVRTFKPKLLRYCIFLPYWK